MESSEFIYKGFLFKQSRYMKKWRRRFVVLSKTHLATFENENVNESPTDILIIKHCHGVKSADDETKKPHSFRVDYSGTLFYFYADTHEEKDKWIGLIS